MEINYGVAFHASEMMMQFGVGIKSSRLTIPLDHGDHSDLRKGQKRSVYGVERDAGKYLPYLLEDCECAGMIVGLDQLFVYGSSLRRYLKIVLLAPDSEMGH